MGGRHRSYGPATIALPAGPILIVAPQKTLDAVRRIAPRRFSDQFIVPTKVRFER